ncbi:MAG: N4-gp56 family major capsid protein [Nitrospira sp.]|nr:N4-gp56 family major capsid protein [Nitrospira sp.]
MAGQIWSVSASGGYLANSKLSKQIRHAAQPMYKFRQFTRMEKAIGKGKGDTLDFNKISNVQTAGTTISESARIPETNILIRRGTMTLSEYGNSIPYTGKLDMLSEFSVDNIVTKALRDDMAKAMDAAAATVFKSTDVSYSPQTSSTGTWNVAGSPASALVGLNLFHVKEVIDALKTGLFGSGNQANPVMPYEGDDYICIASVNALRGIKDDPDFEEVVKYADPKRLLNGEVGRIYNCRFIETNNTAVLTAHATSGNAVFFGADPVLEAVAQPEEIRAKIPEDYGRSKGIAWYALLGFGIVWDYTTDTEQHIVLVPSV